MGDLAYTNVNPHVGAGITDADWEKTPEGQMAVEKRLKN